MRKSYNSRPTVSLSKMKSYASRREDVYRVSWTRTMACRCQISTLVFLESLVLCQWFFEIRMGLGPLRGLQFHITSQWLKNIITIPEGDR